MKFGSLVLLTVFGAALAIVPAQAQSGSRVKVNIPFNFSVGNTTLKAGDYRVQELRVGVLTLSGDNGQGSQFLLTVPGTSANRSQQPKLVFTRYGDESFLNKIFLSGNNDCRELSTSSREKELIQMQASGEELSLVIQPVR